MTGKQRARKNLANNTNAQNIIHSCSPVSNSSCTIDNQNVLCIFMSPYFCSVQFICLGHLQNLSDFSITINLSRTNIGMFSFRELSLHLKFLKPSVVKTSKFLFLVHPGPILFKSTVKINNKKHNLSKTQKYTSLNN